MKRFRKIYVLLGVLAVFCIATFVVMQIEEQKEEISNTDEIILEVDSSAVESLSWDYTDEEEGTETSLAFHKEDNWLYDEDEAFPVSEEKIDELLSPFASFGAAFIIENVEDFSQYGLDDPLCTIRFSTEDADYEIQVGDYSTMDEQRYISIGDGNVYLVSDDPAEYYSAALSDMIDNDEIPDFDDVTNIQFAGSEEYSVAYEEENTTDTYCADDVYFTERDGEKKPLDTERVDSYLSSISGLALSEYVTYNATEEELASYGLDDPELSVTVDYSYTASNEEGEEEVTSDTFVLHVSRDPAESGASGEDEASAGDSSAAGDESTGSAESGASEDTGSEAESGASEDTGSGEEEITAYARVGESQIVYQITGDEYESLMAASYDDLRHLDVFTGDFEDVTQIDISLEGSEYTINAQDSENEDEGRIWLYQEEEIDISTLQSAIQSLTASSFTEEAPADVEEIGLVLHLNNENFPQVQIQLYRYDGTNCIAVVDGEPVSLVSRSLMVDLAEAVNSIVLGQ